MKTYTVKVYDKNDDVLRIPVGTIEWLDKNNRRHCEHGPAMIYENGCDAYYWHGWHVTKELWKQKIAESKYHTIKIDNKTIIISHESYENLKKDLKNA